MKILAIDPATECGWAHSNGSGGTWNLSVRKDESSGMRLIRFEAKLMEVINSVGVEVIAFEVPSVARGKKANLNGLKLGTKLQAIIERITESTDGMESIGKNLSEIKKHATGKGNASKDDMLVAARERFGEVVDDNHADALWLLDLIKTELVVVDENED